MIQVNIEEDREATMTRFMNDLNHDITHIVELYHYVELKEMMHMTMNVKKQLKWKGTNWKRQPLDPLKLWKPNWKTNTEGVPSQQNEEGKTEYLREKNDTPVVVKGNNVTPTSRNCDI